MKNETSTFTDTRDGKTYKIVKIGKQIWMAENLAYKPDSGNFWPYLYDESKIDDYGYLYDFETGKNACPEGWELPTMEDFEVLLENYKQDGALAYSSLIENGDSGFSALFTGWRHHLGSFFDVGQGAFFLSSSLYKEYVNYLGVRNTTQKAEIGIEYQSMGYSIRCIKESTRNTDAQSANISEKQVQSQQLGTPVFGSFKDSRDGNVYKTVKLGSQVWMAENLNYDAGSACWHYDNNPENSLKYGRLYSWELAKNVVPKGWHLPTKVEFETLLNHFENEDEAYDMLVNNDDLGFSALLGGYYDSSWGFSFIGEHTNYWTSTEYHSTYSWYLNLVSQTKKAIMRKYKKELGFSIRCIQD